MLLHVGRLSSGSCSGGGGGGITGASLVLLVLFAGLCLGSGAPLDTCDKRHRGYQDPELVTVEGIPANIREDNIIKLSSAWQVLGPFRAGTRESSWGADPLEALGGFRCLQYDPSAHFRSALATNGTVRWSTLLADNPSSPEGHAKAVLDVGFPNIDWESIRSVYGWSALQYQAWARGHIGIGGPSSQIVALFTGGLLEFWIDGYQYFGGDFYTYRRSPIVLDLDPGSHVIDLRLIRDVRAHGGLVPPRIKVSIEVHRTSRQLSVNAQSLIISEVVEGRIASPPASINVRNDTAEWVDILRIKSTNLMLKEITLDQTPIELAPYQSRPLIFNVTAVNPLALGFPIEIAYRPKSEDVIYWTSPVMINLTSRSLQETQKYTFQHPSGIISYAIIRPPPLSEACGSSAERLPIFLNLHGAGVEVDSDQARHALDEAYGVCAWMLFPSGVTPWSGDDYHTWGSADIQAAIAAIPDWIQSVAWKGPGVSQNKWLVSGHPNGGQGTWFLLTHHPDKIIAGAPVSGYSSIDNYVPFTMWRESEPRLNSKLQNALSSFKHELLLDNLAGILIMQQHGSKDDNVPPYHSRLLADLISETKWAPDYRELLGLGHWFDGVMTTPSLIEFYEQHLGKADYPTLPKEFSITVPTSGDLGSKGWILVDQLQSPDIYGHIQVVRDVSEGVWYMKTKNIHRFHVVPPGREVSNSYPSLLSIDGTEDPYTLEPEELERIWFVKSVNETWIASKDHSWQALSQRYGRQIGSLDAFLRTSGRFIIQSCSLDLDEVVLQVSRNLFQYLAADSEIIRGCGLEQGEGVEGNLVTVALGGDLPPSKLQTFPIRVEGDRLSLWTRCGGGWGGYLGWQGGATTSGQVPLGFNPSLGVMCEHQYRFSKEEEGGGGGLGAVFLRPLEKGRLELVIWGADEVGGASPPDHDGGGTTRLCGSQRKLSVERACRSLCSGVP